jgi:hypothetical protein
MEEANNKLFDETAAVDAKQYRIATSAKQFPEICTLLPGVRP